ncbi:MAG: oxidative damage protection protein [Thalassolituus sp.]|uniref:Probable Fe(2+)-trafficking protein n=1 Tax=Thalassolituus maritimus TaxID=484498 RepID=A0ABP9ZX31_9GAMM|nr:oxidative damage protection protein [Pseudomonadota bacterium]MEC8103894.1 oxidative damage protection protein [Pseudomonadota bacterium]MEC8524656.1 oxidative damage protection protein [Pseudomonadota bacterium]MEE2748980.1 oxidative damage protection protein [Pseudomonadota bacterium]TNC84128.1 MAG: oxidative damage protection protein [Thalassolituus sp.]|tara:strand:+ start:594 stop:863 length:270 start_codon:yes stop_codon:yes gene_type:complete
MTNTVQCQKYGEELPAMTAPPFPGPAGERIMASVSAKAWEEWLEHQKRLINEKHLNVMDPEARKYLTEQREKFLSGDDYDLAEGYVPEN